MSPTFRIRALLLADELAKHGVEVAPFPLFETQACDVRFRNGDLPTRVKGLVAARRSLRARIASADFGVAWILRNVDLLPGFALERAVMGDRRVVLDIDDAIWHGAFRVPGGSALALLKGAAKKTRWLAERADHVVAGNVVLAEWLEPFAARLTVVPSLVDPRRVPMREHVDDDTVVLGWIGSHPTSAYLADLQAPLADLSRAAPDLRFALHTVGARTLNMPGIEVTTKPWSEAAELELLARMDIGLMPLPDTPWTRGKCAYKALQYMSAGIPVVADDVGIVADTIGNDLAGVVVRTRREWTDTLITLARDVSARRRMGACGRRRTEERFAVQRWAPRLAAVLRGDST